MNDLIFYKKTKIDNNILNELKKLETLIKLKNYDIEYRIITKQSFNTLNDLFNKQYIT